MIRNIPRGWLYTAIRVLSLVALVFASALAVDYYFNANTFCSSGASCDVVAKSDFGKKYGIYLPTLGLISYTFFFLSSFFFAKTRIRLFKKSLSTFWLPLAIICCAIGALLFVIVQKFEINAFCYLCMGIDISALLMVIPAILLFLNKSEENAEKSSETTPQPAERKSSRPNPLLSPVLWLGFYVFAAGAPLTWGIFQPPATKSNAPDYIQSFYEPGVINIVEISSFDCPHCRLLHPEMTKILNEYGNKIHFTRLTIPLGPRKEACVAYYCAQMQHKEDAFAECLFGDSSKDADSLLVHAKECSIDETSFKACLVDPEASRKVDSMLDHIRAMDFKGAPTVWIEDTEIIGYNTTLGQKPYRDAIENREASFHAKFPIAFIVCSLISAILIFAGIFLTMKRRKKE